MSKEHVVSQEDRKASSPLKTRRIRGLSQRLRKPLSIESNLAPDVVPPEVEPSASPQAAKPKPQTQIISTGMEGGRALTDSPAADGRTTTRETRPVEPPAPPKTRQVRRMTTGQVKAKAVEQQARPAGGLLQAGTLLQQRYKVLGVIGVGGMGAVYKAQDLRFPNVQRLCAVKEMINTATDPQVRQMIVRNFEREASILATLNHPAIPQVYDYFTEGNRSYLVLEYIEGKDLETLLGETEGFFPEAQVIEWAVQICDVLTYLHNHKPRPIIFRDLKPSNIMLDVHDRIRLVDFGIAKLFQSGEKGTMIGTEGYSPPEQYRGVAEPRGDIYALGATLHHLLSKQDPRLEPPFSFHERPIFKSNPTVSRELQEVIDKALEYDINKRWGSAEEFKRALLAVPTARGISGKLRSETVAFTAAGVKPLWRFACEDEVRAAVTVADGKVFVPSYDHNVYALDAESGKFIWKYAAEGGIGTKPAVADGAVIFGSVDKVIYAVSADNGRLLWTVPTEGRIYSSPRVEFGHAFIGSDDRHLYAVHLAAGRPSWKYQADGPIRTQPYIADNMIFFACQAGMVYALNLDRTIRWRFRSRRAILSSPRVVDGLLYVGSMDWNFYALDVRSGWSAWKVRTGGPIVSSPAVGLGMVFFGSADGFVYAVDAREGRVVWKYEVEEQVTGSPLLYRDGLYIGAVNGILYHLDARSGTVRWHYETDGAITGMPVVANDVLYFGSLDHYVYAIPV